MSTRPLTLRPATLIRVVEARAPKPDGSHEIVRPEDPEHPECWAEVRVARRDAYRGVPAGGTIISCEVIEVGEGASLVIETWQPL